MTKKILLAMSFALSGMAHAEQGLIRLSTDPYATSTEAHGSEVEPRSFAYGDTIVSAFQVGRSAADSGATNIGWATSKDGGQTWQQGFLPHTTKAVGGKYDTVSDVCVAYDAKHDVWMMSLFPPYNLPMLISRSTDGGLSWQDPIELPPTSDGTGIICDNSKSSKFFGRCYAFLDWGKNLTTSDDGGRTWAKEEATAPLEDSFPGVLPDGTLMIGADAIVLSHDGGKSWSQQVNVNPNRKVAAIPIRGDAGTGTVAVDGAGEIYKVESDCQFEPNCSSNGLVLLTSANGLTWSQPVRIPLESNEPRVNHFNAAFDVDPETSGANAHLAVVYNYMAAGPCVGDCQIFVGFTSSTDGGKTWASPTTLGGPMSLSWLPSTNPVGDYMGLSFAKGVAFPFFSFASAPANGHLDEGIYTFPQPLL